MKKLLVLIVASIFTLGAFAQDSKKQATQDKGKKDNISGKSSPTNRSAVTGKFVKASYAEKNPKTTVKETRKKN